MDSSASGGLCSERQLRRGLVRQQPRCDSLRCVDRAQLYRVVTRAQPHRVVTRAQQPHGTRQGTAAQGVCKKCSYAEGRGREEGGGRNAVWGSSSLGSRGQVHMSADATKLQFPTIVV
jgi:hypothetical protein